MLLYVDIYLKVKVYELYDCLHKKYQYKAFFNHIKDFKAYSLWHH